MKMTLIAGAALAAVTMASGTDASARDLHYGLTIAGPEGYVQIGSKGGKNGKYYDYGYDAPRGDHYKGGKHGKNYDYGYEGPRGDRYYGPPKDWRRSRCLGPRQIQRRLRRHGWRDFHVVDVSKNKLTVKARWRGRGRFKLKVDRCNGEILKAKYIGKKRHYYRYGRS